MEIPWDAIMAAAVVVGTLINFVSNRSLIQRQLENHKILLNQLGLRVHDHGEAIKELYESRNQHTTHLAEIDKLHKTKKCDI